MSEPRFGALLAAQREQLERALAERADRFGVEASDPAHAAAALVQSLPASRRQRSRLRACCSPFA
jgi:hypothetical protein